MCAFPHWADCRSDGGSDRSASAVVNNKQTLFCSNSLNSLQQVRVGGIFASAVNTSWSRTQIKQRPEQVRYLSSMWKCRCIEKVFPLLLLLLLCSSIGFMVIWVGLVYPSSSRERTNCASPSFMAVRTSQLMLPLPEKSLYSACPLLNIPSNNVTVAYQQDKTARDTVTH